MTVCERVAQRGAELGVGIDPAEWHRKRVFLTEIPEVDGDDRPTAVSADAFALEHAMRRLAKLCDRGLQLSCLECVEWAAKRPHEVVHDLEREHAPG